MLNLFLFTFVSLFVLDQFLSIDSDQHVFDDLIEFPMNHYMFTSSINFDIYFNGNFIIMYNDILSLSPKV